MRARSMLMCVVFAVGVVLTAGHAGAAPGDELVLQGSRTASIDITLAADTTFDLEQLAMTGSGRFVGFYAEALDVPVARRTEPRRHLGAVQIRDWRAPGQPGLTLSFGPRGENTLGAGRYRVYLLADGRSTVRIPTTGGLDRRLSPARSASASVAADGDILTSPFDASNTQPLQISGQRNVSFSGILVGQFRAYVGTIGVCLRSPQAQCGEQRVDGGFAGYTLSPLSDTDLAFVVEYQPGVLSPGAYVADQGATNATTLQYASAAAFSLALT